MKMNRTTGLSTGIVIALLAWISYGGFASAEAACRIENISLERAGKFTKVTLYADQPWEMVHFTEQAKDGKPYRVIIDCKDALFALPQNHFEQGLPGGTIQRIRTSQYQVAPERIVRVVLDVKGPVVYKVLENTDKRKATIALLTAQDPDFPMWTAVKVTEDAPGGTATGGNPTGLALKTARPEPARESAAYPRALSYADTGEGLFATQHKATFPSPVATSSQPETPAPKRADSTPEKATWKNMANTAPVKSAAVTADAGQNPAQPTAVIRKPTKSAVPLGPAFEEKKVALSGPKDKAGSTQSTEKPVSGPAQSQKTEEVKVASTSSSDSRQTLVQRTPRRRRISRSATPLGPYPEEVTTAQAPQPAPSSQTGGQPTEVAAKEGGTIVEGIGKILGPESVVAKETHLVPESLGVAQEAAPVELDLAPQRKLVTFDPGTKRDPFVPLTERKDMNFGVAPLPLFENLKLVGILRDERGNRALLEDEMGWGYILMSGDRIRNGYVISVEDDKATFQIEEYGGYHTMVLELNPEY